MNDNQKAFLNELSKLLNKYSINEMAILDGRITFESNGCTLALSRYKTESDTRSCYQKIITTETEYVIEEG